MKEREDQPRSAVLPIVCAGAFLSTLDSAIVNLALPVLAEEFESSVSDVLWVSLTFLVVALGLALPMGRLGDLYGRKRIFMTGWAVYTGGLVVAAAAPSLAALLAARVVQAAGAAMVGSNGAAIITAAAPGSQRGKALGILAATVGAGQAAGPIVGGVLMGSFGWRSVFWLRVPFALALLVAIRRTLPEDDRSQTDRGVDLAGSILIVATMGSLVLAINRATAWSLTGAPWLALLALSGCAAVAFVGVERRASSPVVDLALFRSRGFSLAVLTAILHHFGRAGVVVLLPYYLIEARSQSLLQTSMIMVAIPLTLVAVAPVSGSLSDKYGPRALTTIAQAILIVALLLLATVTVDTSVAGIVLRLVLVGCGAGLFGSPNTSAIMNSAPPSNLGTASASSTTARQVGQAIGVAVAGAIFAAHASSSSTTSGDGTSGIAPAGATAGLQAAMWTAAGVVGAAMLISWARPGHKDHTPPPGRTAHRVGQV